MTDEVQTQSAAPTNPVDSGVAQQPAQATPEVAAGSQAPVDPASGAAPQSPGVPPQPDAAAAPVVAAQAPAPEVPAGETLIQKAEDEGEAVVLDTAAGVVHAHSMVSTWLQRVEAGLHVPLDELRALKARLEKWL